MWLWLDSFFKIFKLHQNSSLKLNSVHFHHTIALSHQVPYETLNKRFRAAQKNIDRETSHVTMVVAELEKTLSSFPVVDSVVSLLDGVVEKLSALKRKVRQLLTEMFDIFVLTINLFY